MVRYSDELIEDIRNNNDIVDIISQYVVLKRSGRNFFGLCPFHKEKSPSFSVSPDKQIFHCFGCGVGGNVLHFIQKIENVDFKESIQILAERSGITLPTIDNGIDTKKQLLKEKVYEINKIAAIFYHENLYKQSSKQAQEYIKKRKLDNNTLKSFLIGFSGNYSELYEVLNSKGFTQEEILSSSLVNKTENGKFVDRFRKRLMFPISDVRGRIIAFGGRVLDDSKPKYINSPENIVYSKGKNLYGLNVAKTEDLKRIIIVEGYMDAISLHQRGIKNVVASLGTALTENQGRLLRKYSQEIIIGYDSDVAGQTATLRGLEILKRLGCDIRILQLENAKDPDEYVIKYGGQRFNNLVNKSISLVEFKVKILKQTLNISSSNDKIKFLNQIAKILSSVDNKIELEIYVNKISEDYKISKEAIYGEVNKLIYSNSKGSKILEKNLKLTIKNVGNDTASNKTIKRENLLIYLLISVDNQLKKEIEKQVQLDNINLEINKKIIQKLYDEFKKGDININNVLNLFKDEESINHITEILSEGFDSLDIEKCTYEILNTYNKEKMQNKKLEILKKLEDLNLTKEERANLENSLNEIIIKLAKIK